MRKLLTFEDAEGAEPSKIRKQSPFGHFTEHLKGTEHQQQRKHQMGTSRYSSMKEKQFKRQQHPIYGRRLKRNRENGSLPCCGRQIGAPVSSAPPEEVVARAAFLVPAGRPTVAQLVGRRCLGDAAVP
jgi:hypothetical protein